MNCKNESDLDQEKEFDEIRPRWCHDVFVNNNCNDAARAFLHSQTMVRLDPSLHPELTPNAIGKLFKSKIYSVLSFVDTDPELIVKITGMQFRKVLMVRKTILTKFSSNLLTGYKSYVQCMSEGAIIATGISAVDKLLGGGLITGNIYELCGAPSSGKTQISMTIAVNVCNLLGDESVLCVDTKNDITGHRIMEIIENNERKIEDAQEFMQKIKICRIARWSHLLNFLQQFSRESSRFRLLIIDSLPLLYFRFVGDEKKGGFVFLNSLANLLRFIAVEKKMVILVTNVLRVWSCENGDEEFVDQDLPFLGKYWNHVPNTRIIMKELENCGKRMLIIMKSSDYPTGKAAEFTITRRGVE